MALYSVRDKCEKGSGQDTFQGVAWKATAGDECVGSATSVTWKQR